MASENPMNTVIAVYRVRPDRREEFLALLSKHYPVLKRLGLVTDDEPIVYSGAEHDGGPIVFEIFTWKNAEAPGIAHQTPDVAKVWEAMGTMTEERDGRPKFFFPHVEKLDLAFAE